MVAVRKSSPFRCLRRLFVFGFLFVLLVVVGLLVFAGPIATQVARKVLPGVIEPDSTIGKIEVSAFGGRIALRDVSIAQPEGYGEGSFVTLKAAEIVVAPLSVVGNRIVVKRIVLDEPSANLVVDENGRMNVEALMVEAEEEAPPEDPADEGGETAGLPEKTIVIEELVIRRLNFAQTDRSAKTFEQVQTVRDFDLTLRNIEVDLAAGPTPGVRLGELVIRNARIAMEKNLVPGAEGEEMIEEITAEDAQTAEAGAESVGEEAEAAEKDLPPFVLAKIDIKNLEFSFRDLSVPEKPIVALVQNIAVDGTNIRSHSAPLAEDEPSEGRLDVTFNLVLGETDPAPFTLETRLAPIAPGVPSTVGFIDLNGLQLEGIDASLPPGTRSALGGNVIDLSAQWIVGPQKLSVLAEIVTERGVSNKIRVAGTPDDPEISGADVMLNLLARPGALAQRLAGDALSATSELAVGALSTAGELAQGAGRAVGELGSGLFSAGQGLLSGDLKKAGEGVRQATVGTVETAGQGVVDAAGTAGDAVASSGNKLGDGERVAEFVNNRVQRHRRMVDEALKWLEAQEMP